MPPQQELQDRPTLPLDWDHSSHDAFFSYYAAQSLSERTFQRSLTLRELILGVLGPERSKSPLDVVDIGCGAGAQCQLWAELGHRVHGLDVNAPLVELARHRAAEQALNIEFLVGSAVSLPWPDDSMDVCLAPELLEHVADWETCLDEFCRVLRPGGVLYLSTTNKLCPIQEEFTLPFYSWYPGPLKRYYERLAVTTRPELVSHAKYPAVNWFTFYSLRAALGQRGLSAKDRFDVMDLSKKSMMQRRLTHLIRALPPLRLLAQFLTPYTAVIAIKR